MTAQRVKSLVDEVYGPDHLIIGKTYTHPDGYRVKITRGRYWGTYGLSNFFYWKKILKNGKLSKKEYCGYGWI